MSAFEAPCLVELGRQLRSSRPDSGECAGMCRQSLVGHAGPIFSLKWNKKGDMLLTGSLDKTAIVWNTKAGTIKQQFSFHSGKLHMSRIETMQSASFTIAWPVSKHWLKCVSLTTLSGKSKLPSILNDVQAFSASLS